MRIPADPGHMWTIVLSFTVAAAIALSCSGPGAGPTGAAGKDAGHSASSADATARVCAPGQQVACACLGGKASGIQLCTTAGQGYGACTGCSMSSSTGASSGSGSGSGGSALNSSSDGGSKSSSGSGSESSSGSSSGSANNRRRVRRRGRGSPWEPHVQEASPRVWPAPACHAFPRPCGVRTMTVPMPAPRSRRARRRGNGLALSCVQWPHPHAAT